MCIPPETSGRERCSRAPSSNTSGSGCNLRAFVSRTASPHPVNDARGPRANSPQHGHLLSAEPSPPGVARVTVGLPITQATEWATSLACQTHILLLEGESGPRCPLEDAPRGEGPDTQAWSSSRPSSELYRKWTDASRQHAPVHSFTPEPGSLCPNGI